MQRSTLIPLSFEQNVKSRPGVLQAIDEPGCNTYGDLAAGEGKLWRVRLRVQLDNGSYRTSLQSEFTAERFGLLPGLLGDNGVRCSSNRGIRGTP